MGLLTGKIALHVLKSAHAMKREDALMRSICERPYEPLKDKKLQHDCWVQPEAEIEEDFKEAVGNPGDAKNVVLQFLHAEKKPNAKAVKRKFADAFKKACVVKQALEFGWKPSKEFRAEVMAQVREEEAIKSSPSFALTQICAMRDKNVLLVATRSEKVWKRASDRFFEAGSDAPDGVSNDFAPELLALTDKQMSAKMTPFTVSSFITTPPQDGKAFVQEFLTWMVLRALDAKLSADIDVVGWVKMVYVAGEKTTSTLKASDGSRSTAEFAAAALLEGALVDEIKLSLKGDWFKSGKQFTVFKLDSTGYISDLDPEMPKDLRTETPALALECVYNVWEAIMKEANNFLKLRLDPQKWSKEAAKLRDLAKKAAE